MTTKPNYFKTGLFVIIAILLAIGIVIFFGAGLVNKPKIYFETYFDGSVSGLSVGAPVKDRGVKVGQVEEITFASSEYKEAAISDIFSKYQQYVMVVASVDEESLPKLSHEERKHRLAMMIKHGLRVQLASELLTGIAYLEANYYDPNRYPPLEIPWQPRNYYLPSAPGEFSTIKTSLDRILAKLEKIDTDRIGKQVQEILTQVNKAVVDANIAGVSREVTLLLGEVRQSNLKLQHILASRNTNEQITDIPEVLKTLNATLQRMDTLIESKSPYLDQVLEEIRETTVNLNEITENLKQNPSNLLFSSPPPKSEVYNEK